MNMRKYTDKRDNKKEKASIEEKGRKRLGLGLGLGSGLGSGLGLGLGLELGLGSTLNQS